MFAGLHAIGYSGFVTVHQAFADVMPVEEAVRRSAEYLKAQF
jgi:sugar phosphate isomerase/epimerase